MRTLCMVLWLSAYAGGQTKHVPTFPPCELRGITLLGVVFDMKTCSIYPADKPAPKPNVDSSQLEWDALGQRVADGKPEAIDIPAQLRKRPKPEVCPQIENLPSGKAWCEERTREWYCKNPKRGLWHDEQVPLHFYCRKPQTETGP